MKRPIRTCVSLVRGFTLVEVLIALAIAALGFGVVLHSLGLQMSLVGSSLERHQMLMYASEALEANLTIGTSSDTEVEVPVDQNEDNDRSNSDDIQSTQYFYSLGVQPVTADPRIQQVSVKVQGRRGQVRLAAYRLRVRREAENESEEQNEDS